MCIFLILSLSFLFSCVDKNSKSSTQDSLIDVIKIDKNNTTTKSQDENITTFIPSEDELLFPPPLPARIPLSIPATNTLGRNNNDDCDCRDYFSCTLNYCQEDGSCTFIPKNELCNNNDDIFCNGIEICDPKRGCIPGPYPCDDTIDCTVDQCGEETKSCTHIPDNNLCTSQCQKDAICDPSKGCVGGINLCDDHIDCTVDSCDNSGNCLHVPNNNLCEQTFCSPQICTINTGCEAAASPCDDNILCTSDTCNENDRNCTHTPNDTICRPNNDFCHSLDTCNVNQGCVSGETQLCNDNIPCTVDSCSDSLCANTPNNALCQTGIFCNAEGICDLNEGGCIYPDIETQCSDGIDCTTDFCDFQDSNKCFNLINNSLCSTNPEDWCNGLYCDIAMGGCFQHAEPFCQLDDNIECTLDSCITDTGSFGNPICLHTENDNACTNAECARSRCSAEQGCVLFNFNNNICNNNPPSSCYVDRYCRPDGSCNATRDDALCQRDISETNCIARCDFYNGCIEGSNPNNFSCNDNVSCTYDYCDANNKCAGSVVRQGQCNVDPSCSIGRDCEVDTNSCPTQSYSAQCREINGTVICLQNCPV